MKNGVRFDNGTKIETNDVPRILNNIQENARHGINPLEMSIDNVRINVEGLEVKTNAVGVAHSNYIESKYKNWKIRVWRDKEAKMYCCNYFIGEKIRYVELDLKNFRDENGVFKYVQNLIDDNEE